jgi:hypothetical protein
MALINHEHPVEVTPPWEPGASFGLRLLAWPERDEAQLARTRRSFAVMEGIDPDIMAALPQRAEDATATPSSDDPLDEYDLGTLLKYGLATWSYEQDLTEQNKALLDDRTAKWIGREIIRLNCWSEEEAGNLNGRYEAISSVAPDSRNS